ncbi:DUF3558 domain-containing protein [Saccharomonospora xinjiangensis]|uniref:DUF3558 domain-containing protein n=1 Tax=Saccharomonospora xinjiangensis TaxID=75294 RepID=UPI00106F1B00|nr:DUF3558 domain-containing protein [Saccharomonospora xinjiangensis]QBQ60497.1 hypothetical protein EYD13_10720 [Saccharomonospora xinjiangensis]
MKRMGAVLCGCAVVVAAGCSAEQSGEAAPKLGASMSHSASSPGSPGLPHSGAPAVTDPLPESVLSDHPCEVLTPEQVQQALGRGASAGERKDLEPIGPGCDWSNSENLGAGFQIGFSVVSRQGLSAQYANTKPQKAIFRELPSVAGFPAVAFKESEDNRHCTVAVGLANEYSITATVSLSFEKESEGTDSCVPAEKVAAMVVGNLKAKAGG